MATSFDVRARLPDDLRFFRMIASVMAATIIAAFSLQFAMGRSSLSARPLVHVHGLVFMVWVGIFAAQAWLGATGLLAIHRRLGKLAAFWVPLMVLMGTWITLDGVQRGSAPFFFQPQYFLIANPLTVFAFAFMVIAAVRLRHRTDWHLRLQIGAMTMIMGPAFGRLLPAPLMMPWVFEISALVGLAFPLVGIVRDVRRGDSVHPAWLWTIAVLIGVLLLAQIIASSPLGDAIYSAATAGHPGAALPGMAYPPPPPMPGG
jgi:hypothetical protein